MQHRRTIVAAEHRRDRGQLQLSGDGTLCADRGIDEFDRQVDGGQEADAGDATRHPRQQASQRAGGAARRDHDDDLGKSIIALQLDDRLRRTLGNTAARTHPTRDHLRGAAADGRVTWIAVRADGDHPTNPCLRPIVSDGCHGVVGAYMASASATEHVTTPSSSTTAASHGGRTTAATAIGSSRPDDSDGHAHEQRRIVGRTQVTRQLEQGVRVRRVRAGGQRDEALRCRPDGAAGQTRTVAQHRAAHLLRAGAGQHQGDVGTEATADDGRRAQFGESDIGVGQQDLGGVSTTRRDRGVAVTGEVERNDGPGPSFGPLRRLDPARLRPARAAATAAVPSPSRSVCRARSTLLWRSIVMVMRTPGSRAPSRRRGRAVRCARSGRHLRAPRARPPSGRNWVRLCGNVPHPISSSSEASRPEERHAEPGQSCDRPLRPPRAETAEAHRRVDLPAPAVRVLPCSDGDEVAQPLERQARVHPPTAPGELLDGSRVAGQSALRRRWSSQPEISLATIRVRSCSATSGTRRFDGSPSRLTRWLKR